MRLGPRRTPAVNARKCIGAGNPVRPGRMGSPSNHSRNHCPSAESNPSPFPNSSPRLQPIRACEREGGGGGDERHADGMAITLRYLATTVTDLWHGPYTLQPWQSIDGWRELSPTGHVNCGPWGAQPCYTTKAEALAVHITTVVAQGRRFATLLGVVSSVHMAERLELILPTVQPLHWLLCEAADRLYCPRPPRQVWATEDTFRTIAEGGLAGDVLTAVAALAAARGCQRRRPSDQMTRPRRTESRCTTLRSATSTLRREPVCGVWHGSVDSTLRSHTAPPSRLSVSETTRHPLGLYGRAMAAAGAHMRAIGIRGRWQSER